MRNNKNGNRITNEQELERVTENCPQHLKKFQETQFPLKTTTFHPERHTLRIQRHKSSIIYSRKTSYFIDFFHF